MEDGKVRNGIKIHSPLLDLQYPFDIIHDVPVDEFHLLKEGITKLLCVRIFTGSSVAAKEITAAFDEIFVRTRVFSETPRRPRSVCRSINKFKGSEYGTLMLSGLPALFHDCIEGTSVYWFVFIPYFSRK